MKKLSLLLLVVGFLSSGFAQDASVFEQYKIPTYEYKYLDVYGTDFLHYVSQAGNSRMYMNFGGNFSYVNQSPMMSWGIMDNLNYNSDSKGSPTGDATSTMTNTLQANARKYIMDDEPRGVFAYGTAGLAYSKTTDVDATKMLPLEVGAGYGRVTEERSVAQAIVVLKELGADASNENVLKLADIISKSNSGYYANMYKDDAAIMYYKDIASVTGKAEDAVKVQRILGGGIYQISTRWFGWAVMGGYRNPDMVADPSNSGGIRLGGQYAMPMDMDKQFFGWAWYSMDLNDNPVNNFNLGASFSIDHTYLWASMAKFEFTQYMPDIGDSKADWSLSARSDYFVLNQMSLYGQLEMANREATTGVKDTGTDFRIGGRYIIDLH
ncbi:MAG: hypothetical protein KGZ58_13130 [Ignavibacteriales bacterium]|nr:hypothetical protein [Ignavibacteriales bacterium]